jgi:hypothetical protein
MKHALLFWLPRILGILTVLFMIMFSIDCFDGDVKLGKALICLVMHNIPALIFAFVVFVAWKWELIGGILILALTFAGFYFFRTFNGNPGSLIVLLPLLVTALLFVLAGIIKKKEDVKK